MKYLLASFLFLFSFTGFSAPDHNRNSLADYGITLEKPERASCVVRFTVSQSRTFNSRSGADSFCNGFNQSFGLGRQCLVRQYSSNYYGGAFRFQGFATRSSFFAAIAAIIEFLADAGLLNINIDLDFDFSGPRSC